MIAKYDGKCKVTGMAIVAGETELVKVNGTWQVKVEKATDGSGKCPPSVARHTFTCNGYTCYVYAYTGSYGHWRVWKIEDAAGNLLNLDDRNLNLSIGGNRSNIAFSAAQAEKSVAAHLDWYLDVDGQRSEHEAKKAAYEADPYNNPAW